MSIFVNSCFGQNKILRISVRYNTERVGLRLGTSRGFACVVPQRWLRAAPPYFPFLKTKSLTYLRGAVDNILTFICYSFISLNFNYFPIIYGSTSWCTWYKPTVCPSACLLWINFSLYLFDVLFSSQCIINMFIFIIHEVRFSTTLM